MTLRDSLVVAVATTLATAAFAMACEPLATGSGAPAMPGMGRGSTSPTSSAEADVGLDGDPADPNDASAPDVFVADASLPDASLPDASLPDTSLPDASTDVDGDEGLPVVATVTLDGEGCPAGSAPDLATDRIPIRHLMLDDAAGTSDTMHAACVVRHELAIPRGYRIAGGPLVADARAKLPALGRASVKLRVQVDDGEPVSVLTPLLGPYDDVWSPSAELPALGACDQARVVHLETQVSATLRAERANTEPRRLGVTSLRFPSLRAVPCRGAEPADAATGTHNFRRGRSR